MALTSALDVRELPGHAVGDGEASDVVDEGRGPGLFDDTVLECWLDRVNKDAEFLQTSRWTDVVLELRTDDSSYTFSISRGGLARADDRQASAARVVLWGSAAAWRDYMQPVPAPPNHHILAMDKLRDDFQIASDQHVLIQNLRVICLVLQLLRGPREQERTHGGV